VAVNAFVLAVHPSVPARTLKEFFPTFPTFPAADETEARAKYDEVMRAEWDNLMDAEDGLYPGDPDEAQERIRRAHGAEWSRWELTRHEIEITAAG
jgi:hypothetical protein